LLAAAGFAHADAASDNRAAEKDIRATLSRWTEATNRGDLKTALSVWAPNLVGWSADSPDDTYPLETEFAKQPPGPVKTRYGLTINEVIVDGSLAVVRDTWTKTTKRDSGPDKVATFRSYEIWRSNQTRAGRSAAGSAGHQGCYRRLRRPRSRRVSEDGIIGVTAKSGSGAARYGALFKLRSTDTYPAAI